MVTGATSGLGRAIALRLAADGAEVLVHGRAAARGAETVESICTAGGKARFVQADLGDAASVARLAEQVDQVDILVNNAGFWTTGPTAEFDVASFDAMWARLSRQTAGERQFKRPAADQRPEHDGAMMCGRSASSV